MKIPNTGSSLRQAAYARRVWGAKGEDKKSIALDVGYTENTANSIASKIENRKGFHNAIARLAADSGNLAVAAMAEFKARGFDDFTNKDLVSALNAIAGAWGTFNKAAIQGDNEDKENRGQNRLKTVILQNIAKQTNITNTTTPEDTTTKKVIEAEFSEGEGENKKRGKVEETPPLDF